ncbi:MAG: hypothetical protein ACXVZO_06700 [Gaiellaceae bacterium]
MRGPLLHVLALLSVLAVPAAAFALVLTLPRAPAAERIASDALGKVRKTSLVRSVETLPGQVLRASCRTLGHRRSLVTFSNGVRLRLENGHVTLLHPRRLPPQLRRSLDVEVALAGCPTTVARLLRRRLDRSVWEKGPTFLRLRTRGDLYVIRLSGARPLLELELSRTTLEAVGIVLRAGRLTASSRLVAESPRLPRPWKPA